MEHKEQLLEMLLAKIKVEGDCWLWTGNVLKTGYGRLWHNKRPHRTHRLMFEIMNGPIEKGKSVCHTCDILWPLGDIGYRKCIRHSHLFQGSHKDNMKDMAEKGRAASGLRHGRYTKPEQTARGSRHWATQNPQAYLGELNPNAKLTRDQVNSIRSEYKPRVVTRKMLAAKYSISRPMIDKILGGSNWII